MPARRVPVQLMKVVGTRLVFSSTVGDLACSSSVAPRLLTAAAAWLKPAIRGKIFCTRCLKSVMCCGASLIQVNAGRPSWKKPIATPETKRQRMKAAEIGGGMRQQDDQRVSGFK